MPVIQLAGRRRTLITNWITLSTTIKRLEEVFLHQELKVALVQSSPTVQAALGDVLRRTRGTVSATLSHS